MANSSQQSCGSPSDPESSHEQDSTSSRPASPATTPASEVASKVTRLTLEEYTARKKKQAAAPQASSQKLAHITLTPFETDDNLIQHCDDEPFVRATPNPRIMATTEGRAGRYLLLRRKNDKLESANRTATRISTPRSKFKENLLSPAIKTATPVMASGSALENYLRLLPPTKTPDHIPGNRILAPISAKTYNQILQLEDDALVRATTTTTPVVTFDSPFPLLHLPRELRDSIYAYLTPDEEFWISRPPVVGKRRRAIVERFFMRKPATLIQSEHSLIFACRDTRDEFRCALWRDYVDSDRQVPLRVYDFDPKPISDLFAGCTPLELPKSLQKGRYRVSMYLTGDPRRFRNVARLDPRGLIQTLIMRWVDYCDENGLDPMYSFSKCTWDDMVVVDVAISQSNVGASPEYWDEFQTDPHFLRLVFFFRKRFGRLLLGRSLDYQDRLIQKYWRF